MSVVWIGLCNQEETFGTPAPQHSMCPQPCCSHPNGAHLAGKELEGRGCGTCATNTSPTTRTTNQDRGWWGGGPWKDPYGLPRSYFLGRAPSKAPSNLWWCWDAAAGSRGRGDTHTTPILSCRCLCCLGRRGGGLQQSPMERRGQWRTTICDHALVTVMVVPWLPGWGNLATHELWHLQPGSCQGPCSTPWRSSSSSTQFPKGRGYGCEADVAWNVRDTLLQRDETSRGYPKLVGSNPPAGGYHPDLPVGGYSVPSPVRWSLTGDYAATVASIHGQGGCHCGLHRPTLFDMECVEMEILQCWRRRTSPCPPGGWAIRDSLLPPDGNPGPGPR